MSSNLTWDLFDVGLWSAIEISVSMICVCLPSLRVLLIRLFPRLRENSIHHEDERKAAPSGEAQRPSAGSRQPVEEASIEHGGVSDGSAGILCQKSFIVWYLENDEVQLVTWYDDDDGDSAMSEGRGIAL